MGSPYPEACPTVGPQAESEPNTILPLLTRAQSSVADGSLIASDQARHRPTDWQSVGGSARRAVWLFKSVPSCHAVLRARLNIWTFQASIASSLPHLAAPQGKLWSIFQFNDVHHDHQAVWSAATARVPTFQNEQEVAAAL